MVSIETPTSNNIYTSISKEYIPRKGTHYAVDVVIYGLRNR